jgi:hypothetical protein
MRKHRSKLFLALLILAFFVVAYILLSDEKLTVKQMTDHADSLVNNGNQPQFKKAFNFMDSCLNQDEDLQDDSSFRVRYERLDKIVN